MVDSGQDLVFPLEGLDEERLARGFAVQALQRPLFAGRGVEYPIDDAHPAGRELSRYRLTTRSALTTDIFTDDR